MPNKNLKLKLLVNPDFLEALRQASPQITTIQHLDSIVGQTLEDIEVSKDFICHYEGKAKPESYPDFRAHLIT